MDSKIYNEQIAPHLKEIKRICGIEKIPFFAIFELDDKASVDKDGVLDYQYETEVLSPGFLGVKASNDKVTQMISVVNGFDVVPPREQLEIFF